MRIPALDVCDFVKCACVWLVCVWLCVVVLRLRVVKFYVLRVGLWFTLYIMVGGYVMVNYVVVSPFN